MVTAPATSSSPSPPVGAVVSSDAPPRAGIALTALVLVAAVANLNLSVANVALPDIGAAFDTSQTALNLVAVGYSLGLAASVLYLGAIGDRYGRKVLLVLGTVLAVPCALLAAYAPSVEILILARVCGGVAAGMAFPTTLALITALWSGPARTRSIATWSAVGGAMAAVGPLIAGFLLGQFFWGSAFLFTVPLAVLAVALAVWAVPAHVNETTDPVDHLGGICSVVFVAALIAAISFAPMPGQAAVALGLAVVAVVVGIAFVWRQRRARSPLYDLHVAARPTFWVAAVAGLVVFGTLMGGIFVGQQFLQNVLGYSALEAGASILPAAVMMVLVAPRSARLIETHGSRFTLLAGYLFCFLGFVVILATWRVGASFLAIGGAYALVGTGVGLAGTPASRSLTGSVPVSRVGMASGTADLQRDLGGAIMQSIMGALLTVGYAGAIERHVQGTSGPTRQLATTDVEAALQRSYSSAANLADRAPAYRGQIIDAARDSFVHGQTMAYLVGTIGIVAGAVLVWRCFPDHGSELRLLEDYASEDAGPDELVESTA